VLATYQPTFSCQAPALQRDSLKFTRVSRSQVQAYYTSEGMEGAAEKLAAKLAEHLPGKLADRLKDALQQSNACPVEHGVLGVIFGVLKGPGGPYLFLQYSRGRHLQGLLRSMGHASPNVLASENERAILELWADQVCFLHSACTNSQPCLIAHDIVQLHCTASCVWSLTY